MSWHMHSILVARLALCLELSRHGHREAIQSTGQSDAHVANYRMPTSSLGLDETNNPFSCLSRMNTTWSSTYISKRELPLYSFFPISILLSITISGSRQYMYILTCYILFSVRIQQHTLFQSILSSIGYHSTPANPPPPKCDQHLPSPSSSSSNLPLRSLSPPTSLNAAS